jgi:signal transduction histidine kinase
MGAYNHTILFVDDNPALLRSVERLLRLEGFSVLLAADGEEALQQLEASTQLPDLIISDISMPKMDGFAFFEEVRRREAWLAIPFLFLTARDQIDDLKRGYLLGADDYLVKPLDQDRLLMIVRGKLKRRDELLSHIQVQQNALNAAKRDLSMMVAHELRTPLVSISMVSDLLSREMDKMETEQLQDLLETMKSGSNRLTRLVEQMVMFVQLQSGSLSDSIQQRLRPSYVRDAVIGAVDRARQFSYRQREVPVQFDEQSPEIQIHGDVGALKHALAELLTNAMTFSPPNEIILIEQWATGDTVWVSIVDHGPGIAEDELERVFVPYHQTNRHKFEQQGIGIGLPLARGIIEAHKGKLELYSVVGKGTQALISLPIYTQD